MTGHDRRGRRVLDTGLTRRDALRLGAAAGTAAGFAGRGAARARQATPAAERPTLRVGVQQLPDSLDPQIEILNIRGQVLYTIFDSLLERDYASGDPPGTGSRLVPMLATDWNRLDDLTLELRLRPDVTFQDGRRLSAADIRYTFDRLRSEANPEFALAADIFGTIEGVEAVDDATVRIVTGASDPLLEKRLATWAGLILPNDSGGTAELSRAAIGTGPYRLVDLRPDEILALEANDAYWGGTPPATRVEFLPRPEVAARVAALVSGELDIVTAIPPDQVPAIEDAAGVRVQSVPITNVRTLYYNTRHPTIQDKRVRQALNLAIDRELIVQTLWNGRALVPRGYQFSDWGDLYNPDRAPLRYDPERARALMAEAGYDGSRISLRTPADYYPLGEEVSQVITEMWRGVGFAADVELIDVAKFYDDLDNLTIVTGSNSNEFADPDAFWIRWNASSSLGQNLWTNDRFEALGEEARRTLESAARYDLYQEMVDLWEDEAPGTVLYIPTESYGIREGLSWQPYAYYFMDFRPDNLSFG